MEHEQLGPYKLARKLGEGGMGAVYEAVHMDTKQPAAVKVLRDALAQQEGFRIRFEIEIETLRKLDHDNIVKLYGFGEHQGVLFYAMEYVSGRSLDRELRGRERFDWPQVLQIGIQLCWALRHAHDRGIVHRDLKPANVLVLDDGRIKLSDFGIAKLWGLVGLTIDGGLLGTAHYMSPEQADGRSANEASDLYSLGCVLYALLAGRPPFMAQNVGELLRLQREAEPAPLRQLAPRTPQALEAIVMKLLSKDPDERIGSATAVARRLQEVGLTEPTATHAVAGASAEDPADDELPKTTPVNPPNAGHGSAAATTPATPEQDLAEATPVSRSGSRFFTVEEASRIELDSQESAPRWRTALQAALVLVLLAAGASILFVLLQPPSADELYRRIEAAAEAGEPQRLLDAEHDIAAFIEFYPTDPRIDQLRDYQDEIDLLRLERRLETRARLRGSADELSPIEQAYLEAIRYAHLEPEVGLAKLQALLATYQDPRESYGEDVQQVLELTQRKVAQMSRRVQASAEQRLALLEQRLDRAEQLIGDDPAAAKQICAGMVELYESKPWASAAVQRARALLAQASSADAAR